MDTKDALLLLAGKKKSGKKQKNKSRKLGRNFRWGIGPDGKAITHSITRYRAGGNRERNKARKAAARARRFGSSKTGLAETVGPVL